MHKTYFAEEFFKPRKIDSPVLVMEKINVTNNGINKPNANIRIEAAAAINMPVRIKSISLLR